MQKFFILYRKLLKQRQMPENKKFSLTDNLYEKVIEFLVREARPGISWLPPRARPAVPDATRC